MNNEGNCNDGDLPADTADNEQPKLDVMAPACGIVNTDSIENGELHWVVDKWSEKVGKSPQGEEIFSDAFFSHNMGYKIGLSLMADYYGDLAIWFHIMRGPFDDILKWPFDLDVEVSLMNQQTGLAHTTQIEKCALYPDYLRYQKPEGERNKFSGGFSNFIPMNELTTKPELCENDQIWIMCSVKQLSSENE